MKKVILLALLMPYMAFGQIVDSFESGSLERWVQYPAGRWSAEDKECLPGFYSLHHSFDNTVAGTDRIAIPVEHLHPDEGSTLWTFIVRYEYDPSSLNNWAVLLMSDSGPECMLPDGTSKGYLLGVNLTGTDDIIRLWKLKEGALSVVVNSIINWQTDIGTASAAKISVERSMEGNWTVSISRTDDSFVGEASGSDAELFSHDWFGIFYRYSSTRDRLLWFDDLKIDGIFYEDKEAPAITGCAVSGRNSIELTLNEEPDDEFMLPGNFSLNDPGNSILFVTKKNSLTYLIEFSNTLINKQLNILTINNICDASVNCTQNVEVEFTPVWAQPGDIVISEIMADPVPVVSLPEKEYLEISNRTEFSFCLQKWSISTSDQNYLFPDDTLGPMEHMIICQINDTSLFAKYGKVTGFKQFPSLNDEGKLLCLRDTSGVLIHGIEYSSDWYGDKLKSNGGWSLEMIDEGFPFYFKGNWMASSSPTGGTPGYTNSVSSGNRDTSFYGILNVFPVDSLSIKIGFSEPVINFPEGAKSLTIEGKKIQDLYPSDLLSREFIINLSDTLKKREVYRVEASEEIKDFAGNRIEKRDFIFGLSEESAPGDILFNELLFNPLPGEPDYIELFNCSEKVIDASMLQLVSVNDGTGYPSGLTPVSEALVCIMPGSYYAITTDKKLICSRYFSSNPGCIFETSSLPSMPDDKGHLILYNRQLLKIDEVRYDETMHNFLLTEFEGVALEKIIPQSTSDDIRNWSSASGISGWGTPGAPNLNKDNEAPSIIGWKATGNNSLEIILNEEPTDSFMLNDNFSLNDRGSEPLSVTRGNGFTYILDFECKFSNRSINTLTTNKICDKAGNCSENIQVSFTPIWAETGDVAITEVMADPLPEVSLPGFEYLELTNLTEYPFNLKNWILYSGTQKILFPDACIKPSEIRILCLSGDTTRFRIYGEVIGLKQFPSLTDEGKLIWLSDSSGNLIHGVEYSSAWYGDELKSDGGWSLEIVDKRFPFYYEGNWMASSSRTGGTPGLVNSVSSDNQDVSFYGIVNVFPDDSLNIRIRFSEPVLSFPEGINTFSIEGKEILDFCPADPLFREFIIKLKEPLDKHETYRIEASNELNDFAGNRVEKLDFVFGLTEEAAPGDILFNELLFNPLPGDPDYIELFNCSDKVIDISRLQFISVNNKTGDTSALIPAGEEHRTVMPGKYYALTTDREKVCNRYWSSDPGSVFNVRSLPSMSDDEGHLVLLNRELVRIDEVTYNEDMHYSLLSGYEGVALEKMTPGIKSEIHSNWHSASESSGWGTPGAQNSMYTEKPASDDKIILSSARITPDSDGNDDFLKINFTLTGIGNVVSVTVYDETGTYVNKLASNLFISAEDMLIWDGTADDGSPVRTGIYILFIRLYDDTGKTNQWKKVCTVIRN